MVVETYSKKEVEVTVTSGKTVENKVDEVIEGFSRKMIK